MLLNPTILPLFETLSSSPSFSKTKNRTTPISRFTHSSDDLFPPSPRRNQVLLHFSSFCSPFLSPLSLVDWQLHSLPFCHFFLITDKASLSTSTAMTPRSNHI
ncbi:hypothetical protein V6Z12_A12G039100 [Gossypium hirsutum]